MCVTCLRRYDLPLSHTLLPRSLAHAVPSLPGSSRKGSRTANNMRDGVRMLVFVSTVVTAVIPAAASIRGRWRLSAEPLPSTTGDISKAVESDKFRLVLVAGLEGAGHHYLTNAGNAIFRADPDLPQISEEFVPSEMPYYLPSCMGDSVASFLKAEASAREQMERLAAHAASLQQGTFYIEDTLSRPAFFGAQKVMQYLDLQRVAQVAEEAGVDLRVVYLRRSAKDLIVANTVNRNLQDFYAENNGSTTPEWRFMEYIKILLTDIAVLQSFLGELPRGLVVCHDWDRLGDQEQAAKIARFVAPNEEMAVLFEDRLVGTVFEAARALDGESLPYPGADALAARLQQKLDAFEGQYCGI